MTIEEKFDKLGIDNAPGQEGLQNSIELDLRGERLEGPSVDFSHGDVCAHPPVPGSFELFAEGVKEGAGQAYTPYRGRTKTLKQVANKLETFTGTPIDPDKNLILTAGTQGALFLAMGSCVITGDKVAIVEPDYFANRKIVEFLGGNMVSIPMNYNDASVGSGIDIKALETAFKHGVKVFLFSNPNNPVGCIYSYDEICKIASLARKYNVTVIVDELYSRQIYFNFTYTHLCAQKDIPENLITIMGPSKTESLSGYRLGVAFGTEAVIERMEKLQAITTLRCGGYNQAVLGTWFNEPKGWLANRIKQHQEIRDAILDVVECYEGVSAKPTEGGSYLFITIPELDVSLHRFIGIAREMAQITVTPGTEFGPQYLHQFRINFSQDKDKAVEAMERLMALMKRYRKTS